MSSSTLISRATTNTTELLARRRPWRQLLNPHSLTRPLFFTEFTIRIKKNLLYFRVNYAMIILFILFLSLLWHPISLIIFIIIFILWFFLYFWREEPLVILSRSMDDRVVLGVLFVVTVVGVGLSKVWVNVVVSIMVGIGLVVVHAGFRGTEDLYLDAEDGGLSSFVGSRTTTTTTAAYTRI